MKNLIAFVMAAVLTASAAAAVPSAIAESSPPVSSSAQSLSANSSSEAASAVENTAEDAEETAGSSSLSAQSLPDDSDSSQQEAEDSRPRLPAAARNRLKNERRNPQLQRPPKRLRPATALCWRRRHPRTRRQEKQHLKAPKRKNLWARKHRTQRPSRMRRLSCSVKTCARTWLMNRQAA